MSYTDYPANSPVSTPIVNSAMLPNINENIRNNISEYSKLLSEIESKLQNILNNPVANGVDSSTAIEKPSDFCSAMNSQIYLFSTYNARLYQVLEHIKSIIG